MAKSRRDKHKGEEHEGGMERWLLSYADFITLLMVFFVILYSMSKVDINKYAQMANSLSMVLSGQSLSILNTHGPTLVEPLQPQNEQDEQKLAEMQANQQQLEEVYQAVNDYIKAEDNVAENKQQNGQRDITKLSAQISINQQERGLVISLKDTLLFESGSAKLTARAEGIIKQVGGLLENVPNYIRVEGHTDNLPISTSEYPSNWELSVLRATSVVHVLNEQGNVPSERLSIIGYGEYRPLVANEDNVTRAMNRRVDIVILKKKYDYFETASNVAAPST